MKRLLVVVGLAAIGYLAIPLIAGAQSGMAIMAKGDNGMPEHVGSTGGKVHVLDYATAPDGGTVRQSADELGRAYVRSVSADGGIPEVALPAGESANDPLHVVPGDGTAAYSAANPQPVAVVSDGSAVSAASPMPVNVLSDGSAVGTANPLPTTPAVALHPAELTVSTTCLFLTLPSASSLTPTAGQRYRLMARNDYVCLKSGEAPVSCEGVPMFAPDAPESVAFAAGDLYFFTPGTSAAIELCPLVEQ